MPRVKSVSLKEICMNFILENQDFFCKRITPRVLEDSVDVLVSEKAAVISFDELPTELLEELMRILGEKESNHALDVKTHKITPLFKLLMTNRLRTLNLTRMAEDCSDKFVNVLHLATIRSPNLETLRLDGTTLKYVESFDFISKFTKLRILDISFSKADDECLNLIGKHCPDLRELHVKYCKMTDDGIRKLCLDGICKSIHLLNLQNTRKITTKGIRIALDNLPQLMILSHESLLECLAGIAQTAIDQKLSLPEYSLTALYMLHNTVYKIGSLQQSVLLCLNVTDVYLDVKTIGFKDNDLLSLLSLKKLYTIEITHGVILESLPEGRVRIDNDLSFEVDIPIIIKFCPNLESLTLDCCKTTQITKIKVKTLKFQNLQKLILRNSSTNSSENLCLLLSSPSLSYVSISMFNYDVLTGDALTDSVLTRAATYHSFRNLEYLHLSRCNSVTKNGIDIFLKESNPLTKIVLGYHPSSRITRENIIDWNDNAIWIKKNWQFDFVLRNYGHSIYLGGSILEGAI